MSDEKPIDGNDPMWPKEITKRVFADEVKKYRYYLFGGVGSWDEYNGFADTKEDLYPTAYQHLKYGLDAHIEDLKTGEIITLRLKDQ